MLCDLHIIKLLVLIAATFFKYILLTSTYDHFQFIISNYSIINKTNCVPRLFIQLFLFRDRFHCHMFNY